MAYLYSGTATNQVGIRCRIYTQFRAQTASHDLTK